MTQPKMEQPEIYDLLIVVDATGSMLSYLYSLQTSLPQIISISALTGCFSRIGLLGYRDYGDDLLEWSGWLEQSSGEEEGQLDLVHKAKSIKASGGGDYEEATKTALAKAYEVMRSEATTILLLFTDAPPHAKVNDLNPSDSNSNSARERLALSDPESYGGFGPSFVDWVSACKTLQSGEKKVQVFCMLEPKMALQNAGYYIYLCTLTRGSCIFFSDSASQTISKMTVEVLLAWMGVEKAGISDDTKNTALPARLCQYINVDNIENFENEDDPSANKFLATTKFGLQNSEKLISANLMRVDITAEVLQKDLPKKATPISDFTKLYSSSAAYRVTVVKQLHKIIESDVRAIALNPVFGTLWRTVCNDRTIEGRDGLISAFGLQMERIPNPDEKAQTKSWLEDSYDFTALVREIINGVPENERFPCLCLDPTLSFVQSGDDLDDADENRRPISDFRRDELLEIGRSCDYKILRRLGRILTRLTYIESAAEMPEHISGTTADELPKIPMALASKVHGGQFWRILLHVILPGTMLSARPAALLAALSLRLGLKPLTEVAEREMLRWRDKWNNIEVPETWSVSCLSLLLDADEAYRRRQQDSIPSNGNGSMNEKPLSLLKETDRTLFEQLVSFKILELNLDTALTAQVGWTPQKTVVPIGPVVVCKSCQYPRSVTIMGSSGKCGHCLYTSYESPEARQTCIESRVSKADGELTSATWVECCVKTCRAQYVVYHVEALKVRPKCHYCRSQGALPESERSDDPAPWVECTVCLNRVIWPDAYRPSSFSKSTFCCTSCTSGRKTIVDLETTAKKISTENTTSWLIESTPRATEGLFTNRSLYHTISTAGADFVLGLKFFPPFEHRLTLKGKLIRNPSAMTATLQELISRRQTARAPCSLCFATFHPTALSAACGRHGCNQRICRNCLSGWYGLNLPGRIINTAALSCPFCRRKPSGRTLAKHAMGIHAVGNLSMAVQEQGHWIYAWCRECSFAKQYTERVCARVMPAEVDGWTCEACQEEREQRDLEAECERVENALRDARMAHDMRAEQAAEALRERLDKDREARQLESVKPCPKCGTLTQKISGCNHIACPVSGCGAHWCYFCGKGCGESGLTYSASGVYRHMREEHGGIYEDDNYAEDDEDEEEDELEE